MYNKDLIMLTENLNSDAERDLHRVVQSNCVAKEEQYQKVKEAFISLFDIFKQDKEEIKNKLEEFDTAHSQTDATNAYEKQVKHIENVEWLIKLAELAYFNNFTITTNCTNDKNGNEIRHTPESISSIVIVNYDESASLINKNDEKRKRTRDDAILYALNNSSDDCVILKKKDKNEKKALSKRHKASEPNDIVYSYRATHQPILSLTPDVLSNENVSVLSDIANKRDTLRRADANINVAVASKKAFDHFDKSAGPSKKMTTTNCSYKFGGNNKENRSRNDTPRVNESDSLLVTAPVVVHVTAPGALAVAVHIAAPVAAPITVSVAAPVVAPVTAPEAVPLSAPVAEPVAVPVAVPVAEPIAAPIDMPVAAPEAQEEAEEDNMVAIGSGRTLIPRHKYNCIKWKTYSSATRGLLSCVFSTVILATHSLTGRPSPAFKDKPTKRRLDQQIVADIIIEVKNRFNYTTESMIKSIITTKCADECKMQRMRDRKSAVE